MPAYLDVDALNWKTNLLFPENDFSPRYPDDVYGGLPSYYQEGFLAVQNAIAAAFIENHQSEKEQLPIPDIRMNRFPYPAYISNLFLTMMNGILPVFIVLSLNYTFMNTVRFISIEKEKQLKEAMKIMGLASWMHYLSWFIRTIIMLTISMILITVLLKVKRIYLCCIVQNDFQ